MAIPKRVPPYMPGYLAPGAGGTLEWSWAEERLRASRSYWLATVWPDGRPHVSPVWGAWLDECLWFSCDRTSRKAKNLDRDGRCVLTTDDPLEPVVLDGRTEIVADRDDVERYVGTERVKYADEWRDDVYTLEFFLKGAVYRVRPVSVFALKEKEFGTSPTRWTF